MQSTKRKPLLFAFPFVRINRIYAPFVVVPDSNKGNTCQREKREHCQRVDRQIRDDLQQNSQGYHDDGIGQH